MSRVSGVAIGVSIVAGVAIGWPAVTLALLLMGCGAIVNSLQEHRHLRWRSGAAGAVCLVIAASLGAARHSGATIGDVPEAVWQSDGADIRIESFSRSSAEGESAIAAVEQIRLDGLWQPLDQPVRVYVFVAGDRVLVPGMQLRIGWYSRPLYQLEPGYAGWLRSMGAQGTASATSVDVLEPGWRSLQWLGTMRRHVSDGLRDELPGDVGALAAGIVTGDDSGLSDEAERAFQLTGTTHITAVSGSNVAVVLAIWFALVPAGKGRRWFGTRVAIVTSIWLYAVMVGLEPPAVRAALMTTVILLGMTTGRRADPLSVLALASGVLVLVDPGSVGQVSFWLSVVASAAIIVVVGAADIRRIRTGVGRTAMGVGLAQLCTMPVSVVVFGSWSLTGLVANLLLAPVMALAFPLCFALGATTVFAPPLGGLVALVCAPVLTLALSIVESLAVMSPALSVAGGGWLAALWLSGPVLLVVLLVSQDWWRWVERVFDEE